MAKRIVNLALAAFKRKDGVPTYALRGETVDVHDDDVDRFDELNAVPGATGLPPIVDDSFEEVVATDGVPHPLDHGDGPDLTLEKPGLKGRLPEWQAYARSQGIDPEGMTKAELVAEFED